jgi:hypothetical protein
MKVSLFNRFQGCLYGSILTPQTEDSEAVFFLHSSILLETIDILGYSDSISLEKWQCLTQNNPREFSLALIPLSLFRHDYLTSLQSELALLSENQLLSPDDALALFCWGHVLSLILREKLPSKNKVEFCLSSLQAFIQGTVLEKDLIGIKQAIQKGYSLDRVTQNLESSNLSSAIALSLYFFLDTPEQFDLSLKRAALINYPLVLSFTGALAGAYHGFTGIPLAWRFVPTELAFPDRIRQFWGQWSGVLPENTLPFSTAIAERHCVIASPLVIQRRPNVPLISQEEYVQG